MQVVFPFGLASLLLLVSFGVKADAYQNVNRFIAAGQWSKAQVQAHEHLKTSPTDPQMRLLLSRIQDGQGQTTAATETLQALTQSYPELPEPQNNLAVLLVRQNRYAEAMLQLQNAVRARPDDVTALENLGDVYIALAIESYQNASQAKPNQARIASKRQAATQLLKDSPP